MPGGLWGRLSLRWQAAIAVLLPCVAVALFSSLYFPQRLNAQAEQSLRQKAQSIGVLASAEIAPTLRLIADGLADASDLDNVFEGATSGRYDAKKREVDLTGSDVDFVVVLKGSGGTLKVSPQTVVRQAVQPLPNGQKRELPVSELAVPERFDADGKRLRNVCELDDGPTLLLRCYVKDKAEDAAEGLLAMAFKKDALLIMQRQNLNVGVWSGIGGATLGLLLALLFGRALANPVTRVTQAAREVASGDVTVPPVEVTSGGEIGSMAGSFNEMLANLRNLVGQMVELTGRLGNASQGLIGASRDQEHVTNQQAAYAQQIAATFEELSRTAEQISASTEVVEQAARNTNEAVEQAKAVVAQVVAGIGAIRGESKQVADAIAKLNADLQQVSKIAQVINAVAERSDLLALNAALEGTKAGEVGRGFSLVAAEMRKLAENVSVSARDIGRIVEKIQESGNEAVQKARVGVDVSDRGVQVAQQASELFQRIVELARGTTEAAQQIAVATRQQKQSSEQAVAGARNVADLVKQGVDATSRTNRIAQDLQAVAQALSAVTSRFRVSGAPPRDS